MSRKGGETWGTQRETLGTKLSCGKSRVIGACLQRRASYVSTGRVVWLVGLWR
jgi:hypothetical protein